MLWDLIRDFFVQQIFGGIDSTERFYGGFVGASYGEDISDYISLSTYDTIIPTNLKDVYGNTFNISLGDWLSTTATIISITIILVLCCLFVYKIIKLIGGLIR